MYTQVVILNVIYHVYKCKINLKWRKKFPHFSHTFYDNSFLAKTLPGVSLLKLQDWNINWYDIKMRVGGSATLLWYLIVNITYLLAWMFLILFDLMQAWWYSQKQNFNLMLPGLRKMLTSSISNTWRCHSVGLSCNLFGHFCLECLADVIANVCLAIFCCLADVIAIGYSCGICYTTCFMSCLMELTWRQMLLPLILVTDVIVTCWYWSLWLMLLSHMMLVFIWQMLCHVV